MAATPASAIGSFSESDILSVLLAHHKGVEMLEYRGKKNTAIAAANQYRTLTFGSIPQVQSPVSALYVLAHR